MFFRFISSAGQKVAALTLLSVIVLQPWSGWAQTIKSFSSDPNQFVKEMTDFLKATKRADCVATADVFLTHNKAGRLSSKLPKIIETSNILIGRNMQAYPHFELYLRTVNDFINTNKADDLFFKWSEILNETTNAQRRGETKDFRAYLDFSNGLFNQNALYISDSKSWVVISDNYSLQYDNGPKATFPSLDLVMFSSKDSITIKGTSGFYFPLEQKWQGNKGVINWSRAGFDPTQVYAEVYSYLIDVTKTEFNIDSVTFYNKQYFDISLQGNLTDKLVAQKNETSYPRFESFRKDLAIKDLAPNVKFVGGFALHGNKVFGTGDDYDKATLIFTNDKGEKIITARSTEILLRKNESLSANKAEVSLYMGADSIYHPGLNIVYKINLKEVNLYRSSEGIGATPFFDSYHQHEIKTDAIIWKLNEPYVDIKMLSGAGKAPATFTSNNFFRLSELQKFQGVMDFNPVSSVYSYAKKYDTREIVAEDLAKKMNPNYTENTIKNLLFKMVEDGFIFYDDGKGLITVRDKVFNYIAANGGLIDYDVIKIQSYSESTNAKMSFDNKDLEMVGVKQVLLSDSQNVFVFPSEEKLTLQKNKDMAFSGKVSAGRLDFEGTGFHFMYDTFMIDLTNLASALIWVPSGKMDKYGAELLVPMNSKIEGLTGFLEIDNPKNKSGKKKKFYHQYPIFTNLEKSYVYYSDSTIHSGTYEKERFFFMLDPFVFDSLDSFNPYLSDFEGDMVSADIFPSFRENLRIQKDLSFGYRRVTPDKGFPIYKGKATYNDSIFLSNEGFRGNGKMKYLFTKIESDNIIFFPDSMDAFAQTFTMDKTTHEGVTFPQVKGANNQIHWLPYADSMKIDMTDLPFVMYDSATFKGNLLFTKKGLKGDGELEFREAALASALFNFESESLNSDTMSLVIKSIAEDKVTFNTPNVRGNVDFKKRVGEFNSNEEGIQTEFANNQYKTSINEFFWDIDGNYLDFKAPPASEGVYFTSTRPDQDSLKFLGKRAFFDMSKSIIDVDSVPEVRVADARIIPDKKRVTILPGGLLDSLADAVVVFDTISGKNKIYNANVTIQSKNKFTGDGIMDYQVSNLKPYPIIIHDMGVKEVKEKKKTFYYTYANGMLEADEQFKLHPKIEFRGDVNLSQERKNPFFNGFGLLNLENTTLKTSWFKINQEINTDSFSIKYDHTLGEDSARMFTGIFYNLYNEDEDKTLYSSIMHPLETNKDIKVIDMKGIIKYDEKNRIYYFGDENKIEKNALIGNMLVYNEKKNLIQSEGKFNFGLDFEPIQIKSSGNVVQDIDSNKFTFNTFLALSVPMHKNLVSFFATDLTNFTFDRPNLDYTKTEFEKAYAEMLDEKRAQKAIEEFRKSGQFQKPKELNEYTLVLSDVKLIYEPYYQTYRSEGPIGISFIGPQGIHKKVKGHVEMGYRKDNDFFNIYFESTTEDWYYISFTNKTLQLLSSNKDFNMLLASIVPSNRKEELANEEFFFYTATTYKKMQDFLYRMQMIAKGIRVEEKELSEEEIFEQELEKIKKELLQYQEDTAKYVAPTPTSKKGKKENISFIDDSEAIPQEQPDYVPVRLEDFLKEEQPNEEKQPEQKGKKSKEAPKKEEPTPVSEDEPETELQEEPESPPARLEDFLKPDTKEEPKPKKGKEEKKKEEPSQIEQDAENEVAPAAEEDDASDFDKIIGGGKKKKGKD